MMDARQGAAGSSGEGADMAVEAHPDPRDYRSDSPTTRAVAPLRDGQSHDQLWEKIHAVGDRQEALLDEALEETFPGSDPISPIRLS